MFFSVGYRLRHFEILFQPRRGSTVHEMCGSYTNDMNTGETVSFTCHHGAIGTALRIRIVDRVTTLTLCEVSVYGTGMNEW